MTSLLAFNVGVEIGQLLVILICVPILRILYRFIPGERIIAIILSVIAGHTAWHWLVERGGILMEYDVLSTSPDGALFGVAGLLALMLIIAAFRRLGAHPSPVVRLNKGLGQREYAGTPLPSETGLPDIDGIGFPFNKMTVEKNLGGMREEQARK